MAFGKPYLSGEDVSGKYILWCPTSTECPKYVFDDRPTAIKASYAMAMKFKHQEFFVCKIVGRALSGSVRYEDLSHD